MTTPREVTHSDWTSPRRGRTRERREEPQRKRDDDVPILSLPKYLEDMDAPDDVPSSPNATNLLARKYARRSREDNTLRNREVEGEMSGILQRRTMSSSGSPIPPPPSRSPLPLENVDDHVPSSPMANTLLSRKHAREIRTISPHRVNEDDDTVPSSPMANTLLSRKHARRSRQSSAQSPLERNDLRGNRLVLSTSEHLALDRINQLTNESPPSSPLVRPHSPRSSTSRKRSQHSPVLYQATMLLSRKRPKSTNRPVDEDRDFEDAHSPKDTSLLNRKHRFNEKASRSVTLTSKQLNFDDHTRSPPPAPPSPLD